MQINPKALRPHAALNSQRTMSSNQSRLCLESQPRPCGTIDGHAVRSGTRGTGRSSATIHGRVKNMRITHWLAGAALAASAAVAGWIVLGTGTSAAPASTFVLLDGTRQTMADLRGKVTLVNFWATSCVTCVGEMPELIATYDKYKGQGYDTLAVAMSYDPPSYVVNFADSRKLPFKVAIDNTGAIAQAWGDIKLTPSTFIVNKRGEIVKSYVGAPDFPELHKLIERLLAET